MQKYLGRRDRINPDDLRGKLDEGTESAKLKSTQESNERRSPSIVEQKDVKPIEVKLQYSEIQSIIFFPDGKRIAGYCKDHKIRCWLVEGGNEVGTPMDVGGEVYSLAVSQDGKWIVAGTRRDIIVWNAESRKKVGEFAHEQVTGPGTLVISPDGTKIASGSLVVRSRSTGKKLLDRRLPSVWVVQFSGDSSLLAAGCHNSTMKDYCLHIYDSENGQSLLANIPFLVDTFTWTGDNKQLFTLSARGQVSCLDVSSGKTLSEWSIGPLDSLPGYKFMCLSRSKNDTFIATSENKFLSLWDTVTHKQIGPVIRLPCSAKSMVISAEYDLVIWGDQGIIMYNLREILPSPYINVQEPRNQPTKVRTLRDSRSRVQDEHSDERVADLEKTIQQLQTQLANSQRTGKEKERDLKSLREDIALQNTRENEKTKDLEKTVQQLHTQLTDSKHTAKAKEDALHADLAVSNEKIKDLEATIKRLHTQLADCQQNAQNSSQELCTKLADSQRIAGTLTAIIRAQCETLFGDGQVIHAAKVLLEIMRSDTVIMDWLPAFASKCITELEKIGDGASGTDKHDRALATYAIALSLLPSSPNALLTKWAGIMLLRGPTKDAMDSAKEFKLPSVAIYRAICDALEKHGRTTEAIEYFQQMQNDLASDTSVHDERTEWEPDFQRRCAQGLEKLADVELNSEKYDKANKLLSTILSLDSLDRVDILIKRSKARAMMQLWEDALGDANEVIKLDPSSPLGYEQRRAALHGMGHFAEAVSAFDTALSKLQESPEHVRKRCPLYTDARPKIREIINDTISNMPLELIDTQNGYLLDRGKQAEAFEADSIFNELVSSMVTRIDAACIRREVKKFYRYVMLSHRWQLIEPRYKDVKNTPLSELKTFAKLKAFCKLVCSLGFKWAWCDTCCVDQDNNVVLQESLVAMFIWYRGSTLTIVYLHDVPSRSFSESEWNKRAWTFQEYVAAETVRFYTKDWEPYVGGELWNHKKSPDIISEMQRISQVTPAQMAVLRPGRDRVREKLFLASKRLSTRVEDIAYSLLGIFGVSIPVIYGEGTRAVGRFLEHILKGSGDLTILAWTGTANEYNTCLPLNLTVYDSLEPPHIPYMETARLDEEVSKLSPSVPDLGALFEALKSFSSPSNSASLDSGRLRLHCISFSVSELVVTSEPDAETNLYTYRAITTVFGGVEIKTRSELSVESEHFVVHPWIPSLLGQEYLRGAAGLDETKRMLRLVVRLRQAFGALLLEKVSWVDYKRVAADSLIMVHIPEEVPLLDLVNNIETIFVQ